MADLGNSQGGPPYNAPLGIPPGAGGPGATFLDPADPDGPRQMRASPKRRAAWRVSQVVPALPSNSVSVHLQNGWAGWLLLYVCKRIVILFPDGIQLLFGILRFGGPYNYVQEDSDNL